MVLMEVELNTPLVLRPMVLQELILLTKQARTELGQKYPLPLILRLLFMFTAKYTTVWAVKLHLKWHQLVMKD